MSFGNTCQYSFDRGKSMSVTTTTENESFELQESAPDGSRKPSPAIERSRTKPIATQRALLIVPPLALALVLLMSWFVSTATGRVPNFILPAPRDVLAALVDGLRSGLFLSNALVTIQESLLGFLLGVIIALPLGYGIAKSRFFAATVQPYLAAGQAIPAIVIAPVLVLWLGYGLVPITILSALRTGLTLSITGALVGEFVSSSGQGLGALVFLAKDQFNAPLLFATLIILAVLAAIYYSATWSLVKLADAIY